MFNPFQRSFSSARKKSRKSAKRAQSTLVKALLSPAAPAKKSPAKRKPSARPATAAVKPKSQLPPCTRHARLTPPRGASFRKGLHRCDLGQLPYKLYIPASARSAQAPVPLLVMLHGCSQSPDDFARGTGMNALAEEFRFLVVYPEQVRQVQVARCWNWYRPEDQSRGSGEPGRVASLIRHVIEENEVDPARVYVAGLSAGASAALVLGSTYPDIFAAVGAHSGLPAGAARDTASAVIAMQHGAPGQRQPGAMPTIIFHGDADKVVHPRNGRFAAVRAVEQFDGLRKTERTGRVAGGREYLRIVHRRGQGRSLTEHWIIQGGGHAWSGGHGAGSFTDPAGPDASREMVRFFLRHRTSKVGRKRAGAAVTR